MKLKTFDRYKCKEKNLSCGIIALSLLRGEPPCVVKKRLASLRRKNNWSARQIRSNELFTYWYEADELTNELTKKTTFARNKKSLKSRAKDFNKGTFLVCTTNHLQVIKDGLVFDACGNGSLFPRKIKEHPWANRRVYCWKKL